MAGRQQLLLLLLAIANAARSTDYNQLLPESVTAWTHYRKWEDTRYSPSIRFIFHREIEDDARNESANSCTRSPYIINLSCSMEGCTEKWCRTSRKFKSSEGYCGLETFTPDESGSNKTWHCQAEVLENLGLMTNKTLEAFPYPMPEVFENLVLRANKTFDVKPFPYPMPLLLVAPKDSVQAWLVDSEHSVIVHEYDKGMDIGYNGLSDIVHYKDVIESRMESYIKDPLSLITFGTMKGGQAIGAIPNHRPPPTADSNNIQNIHRVQNKTIRSLVTMSSIGTLIWLEENEGSASVIKKGQVVTNSYDRLKLVNIQEVDVTCLKSTTRLKGIMVLHWPTVYEVGIEGVLLATSDGLWRMDAEGKHCQQLYSTTWPYGVTTIAADWHNLYWVTELGELFSKGIDGSQAKHLDDFKLSDADPCMEAPDFTNISSIATYGPEQWTPTVPVECFDMHIDEPVLDFKSEEITVKIQWYMEGSCEAISTSPVKIKIEFYMMGCDGEACETKVELGSSFQMTRTIALPSLKPASQYVISISVATPGLMQMWLNPLLSRNLPCDGLAYCFSKTRRDLFKTPEAPINLEETWIITVAIIAASVIILVIILAVVWYIRKQQWFIYRKIEPMQIKEIAVMNEIGEGKGKASKVYKVEVTQEDGTKMQAAMKVVKGTDNARRKLACESFVHKSIPPHRNICGYTGIAFSSITQIIDRQPCMDRGQSDDEQQPGTSGNSGSASASSRSMESKFEIELPYGMEYFLKQLPKDTNSQEVLCQMIHYLSTNMADASSSTTIRYRPLNDDTIICETADPDPKHRIQLATLTKKQGSITLSTQVDTSMFDEQSDKFGKDVLLFDLCHGSLDKYIVEHRGLLTFGHLLDIVIQVAEGTVHLQQNNVRHNDLTLDNVLYIIGDDGAITCKIADFGEAKLLPQNSKYYGAADRRFPWMFAPIEMFKKKEISGSTEVWFLTYFIYQVFTYAKRPWDLGSHPTVADMRQILNNQTPPDIPQGWPERLKRIIRTGLEVDKGKRYGDVTKVLQELQGLKRDVSESYRNEKWPADDQSVSDDTKNNVEIVEQSNPQSEEWISMTWSSQTNSGIRQEREQSSSANHSQTGEDRVTRITIEDETSSCDESGSDLDEQCSSSAELPPNLPYVTY